jgi:hypothetical protein
MSGKQEALIWHEASQLGKAIFDGAASGVDHDILARPRF